MAARALTLSVLAASSRAAPFDLQLLPQAIVDARGAACLDGSRPGVYFMPGSDVTKWRIHFHGGGFCSTLSDCVTTSHGIYGSSQNWPQSVYDLCDSPTQCTAVFGLMSNYTENPIGTWNSVLVPYCDGSSWSSSRSDELGGLRFRGRANLDAVIDQLDGIGNITTTATDVIITGTSSGGFAVITHATSLRARLPASATVVSVPDAGVALDHPTMAGIDVFPSMVREAVGANLWNATVDGLDAACLAHYGSTDAWRCVFGQYLLPFATMPTFVIHSQYDVASMNLVLQPGCSLAVPGQCDSQQVAAIQSFRAQLLGNITTLLNATASGGYFLHSCWQHESSCRWADYTEIRIGGVSMMEAVTAWYDGVRIQQGKTPLFGTWSSMSALGRHTPHSAWQPPRIADGPYGSDATCQPQGFVHGGC